MAAELSAGFHLVLLREGRKFEESMTYLKSILVGLAVASLLVLGYSIISYHRQEFPWGSVVSVDVGSKPSLALGLIGFGMGFFWMFRQSRTSH
jgi:hypothetical protein